MSRFSVAFPTLLLASVAFDVAVASAAPSASLVRASFQVATDAPDADESSKPEAKPRNAGVVEGVVAAVDYRGGTISVQLPSRRIDVVVLPSTNIQGSTNSFHTIADIVKGQRIQVFMSQRGNSFIAEIIHLR
jgi:hypothetical protein